MVRGRASRHLGRGPSFFVSRFSPFNCKSSRQKRLAFSHALCYDTSSKTMGKEVLRLPNIKSAKKRVKVIATKTLQNRAANSQLKTQIKKANAAIESNAGDKEAVVRAAVKKIDQAAAKGILHKNNAARKKAALDKKLHAGA